MAETFSPAFCGGLIEATPTRPNLAPKAPFSPHSAGASLKQEARASTVMEKVRFSPAFCGGLIEAQENSTGSVMLQKFSPAFCGGLIEAMT